MRKDTPLKKDKKFRTAVLFALLLGSLLLLAACARGSEAPVPTEPVPTETPEVTMAPEERMRDAEKLVVSELMIKNKATLRDEDGDFPDWIELENISGEDVELTGWSLSDKDGKTGWRFPRAVLGAGDRMIVFASGKDRTGELHTDFSLSAGETLSLYNANGYLVQSVSCPEVEGDVSLCRGADGAYTQSLYPTPGRANTGADYDAIQQTLEPKGPLVINEVMTANFDTYINDELGPCDWVEIKNISGTPVDLANYYLSDDGQDYRLWQFPERILEPGQLLIVCCDDSDIRTGAGTVRANFGLNSVSEALYLSGPDRELIDYVSLRDIPYGGSYGRVPGENGWFFFEKPSPGAENAGDGYRRVSAAPYALEPDGVFENVASVTVELAGEGTLYYTTDCSVPTAESRRYDGPITVEETTVLRAVAVEEGAMPSRPLTLTYIVNEGHSLPVLSMVSHEARDFYIMYNGGLKYIEEPGNLALYEPNGSFNIPCGIRMYGETSLALPKKNMSVRFRGAYGQASLEYDAFGGGVTEFTNLVIRSGQDFYSTIIRNELGLNLGLRFSDDIMSLRSKYCVLYIDGEYWGIYSLMEKSNEQHYASLAGVSRDSVTVLEANVSANSDLWNDVFMYCMEHDMTDPDNYAHFCQLVDVDSLIDWMVIEGFLGNSDLTSGNLRYCRSTENDGKWRLMFYDLDAILRNWNEIYNNMFSDAWVYQRQLGRIVVPLRENEEFVDAFLTRAGEAINTVFTTENVVAEIDRLAEQVRPEVERDYARFGMTRDGWEKNIEELKNTFTQYGWREYSIAKLGELFQLSDEQMEHYFG